MEICCRYCGIAHTLVHESFRDEDGFIYEEPIDLCEHCVEHSEDRRKARADWEYYHDEPCPEIEMPQPPEST